MANDPIANVIAEMQGKTTERQLREQKKAARDAQQSRIDEDVEAARRVAVATLDERDRRDRDWYATHLGRLSPKQYRDYCQQEFGFDPNV